MAKPGLLSPKCIIIAGPNGAGKTTFAREFLDQEAGVVHFVNPDLIASGLSPLRPELAAIAAGRLFLRELDRLASSNEDFAFESTLSGLTYLNRLKRWKAAGRRIEIVYLRFHLHNSGSGASPRGLNRAGTMCHGGMSCAVSGAAGIILSSIIVFWPTPGACMITRGERQNYWKDHHETTTKTKTTNQQRIFRCSGPRPAPRRQGRAPDRPHARHTHLHLEGRQSRRREAVIAPGSFPHHEHDHEPQSSSFHPLSRSF